MEPTTALLGGGSAVGVMILYWIFKRLRRSTCAIDHCSGCLSVNIPAEEIIKQHTDRIESKMIELINRLTPKPSA